MHRIYWFPGTPILNESLLGVNSEEKSHLEKKSHHSIACQTIDMSCRYSHLKRRRKYMPKSRHFRNLTSVLMLLLDAAYGNSIHGRPWSMPRQKLHVSPINYCNLFFRRICPYVEPSKWSDTDGWSTTMAGSVYGFEMVDVSKVECTGRLMGVCQIRLWCKYSKRTNKITFCKSSPHFGFGTRLALLYSQWFTYGDPAEY